MSGYVPIENSRLHVFDVENRTVLKVYMSLSRVFSLFLQSLSALFAVAFSLKTSHVICVSVCSSFGNFITVFRSMMSHNMPYFTMVSCAQSIVE